MIPKRQQSVGNRRWALEPCLETVLLLRRKPEVYPLGLRGSACDYVCCLHLTQSNRTLELEFRSAFWVTRNSLSLAERFESDLQSVYIMQKTETPMGGERAFAVVAVLQSFSRVRTSFSFL